ncbi:MAG: S41 family peptidase [Chloroflexi bacterium]|nr:S41 family peptidase [Chloroflexota bacterium]
MARSFLGWIRARLRDFRTHVVALAACVLSGIILFGAGFGVGLTYAQANGLVTPPTAKGVAPLFWQAWQTVEQHYVDVHALVPVKLVYGAISGMVNALGDTGHSRFLTPAEVQQEQSMLSGRFVGIGIRVTVQNGRPVIVAPIPGSPAQKAGLKAGDIIIAVDGKDTLHQDFTTVGSEIRGPQGSKVQLKIERPSEGRTFNVTVAREPITVPAVAEHIIKAGNISVMQIHVSDFSANANQELRATLLDAERQHLNGVILDLRDDPGGLLNEAVAVSSEFLTKGVVLIEQRRNNSRTVDTVTPGGIAPHIPLVVLVNNSTASAAEITAGALKDNHRAPLVGVTTFGTGTVLNSFKLSDGSELLLGTEEWLTPNGTLLWHHGVTPTYEVQLPSGVVPLFPSEEATLTNAQILATKDLQLQKAISLFEQGKAGT